MDINFELYKIFYHAATTCSFSRAAQRLYISQSAVSQAIKNLESRMDTQLFTRADKRVRLTPEGEMLYSHVQQAYGLLKSAENKILQMKDLEEGEIRIGAGDTVCKFHLIPFIEQFNKQYPKIRIMLLNRTSSQIKSMVRNGYLDMGIITMPVSESDFEVEKFVEVQDLFVYGKKFDYLNGKILKLEDLDTIPLLLLPNGSSTRTNLDNHLKSLNISVTPEIELESVDLLVEYARIGFGVAHVSSESADAFIKSGELSVLELEEPLPERSLGIITNKDAILPPAAQRFLTMFEENKG